MTATATLLIDSHEPPQVRALGAPGTDIERRYGADIVIVRPGGGIAVVIQRKTPADLFASWADGRLLRQIRQLREVPLAYLLLEGHARWTGDGRLLTDGAPPPFWVVRHRTDWWAALDAAYEAGVRVVQVRDMDETLAWLRFQASTIEGR